MIINSKKCDTSVSTQGAHYNHIKSSSSTSKLCVSDPNNSKNVRVKSFIFLNSNFWGNSIGQEQSLGNTRGSDQLFQFQHRKKT